MLTIKLIAEAQGKNLYAITQMRYGFLLILRDWTKPNYNAYSVCTMASERCEILKDELSRVDALDFYADYMRG